MEILELSSKEMPIFEIIEVIPFEKQFPLCFCTLKSGMGKDGKFSTQVNWKFYEKSEFFTKVTWPVWLENCKCTLLMKKLLESLTSNMEWPKVSYVRPLISCVNRLQFFALIEFLVITVITSSNINYDSCIDVFEGFWSTMASLMPWQLSRLCELFIAYFTLVWFWSGMDSHMLRQVTIYSEFFSARFTLVRLFSSMSSDMICQAKLSCEWFPAYFTWMWLRSCVGKNMDW